MMLSLWLRFYYVGLTWDWWIRKAVAGNLIVPSIRFALCRHEAYIRISSKIHCLPRPPCVYLQSQFQCDVINVEDFKIFSVRSNIGPHSMWYGDEILMRRSREKTHHESLSWRDDENCITWMGKMNGMFLNANKKRLCAQCVYNNHNSRAFDVGERSTTCRLVCAVAYIASYVSALGKRITKINFEGCFYDFFHTKDLYGACNRIHITASI